MQTDSSPLGDFSTQEAQNDRDTFCYQTLLLTALTALNNDLRRNHPTIHEVAVFSERLTDMKNNTNKHTRVMDAATAILITDTEILATMTHGVQSIVAVREEVNDPGLAGEEENFDACMEQADPSCDRTLICSFPNINNKHSFRDKKNPSSSTSESPDNFCKPITAEEGFWKEILKFKTGFVDSKR
jgi:hypothetical protein